MNLFNNSGLIQQKKKGKCIERGMDVNATSAIVFFGVLSSCNHKWMFMAPYYWRLYIFVYERHAIFKGLDGFEGCARL